MPFFQNNPWSWHQHHVPRATELLLRVHSEMPISKLCTLCVLLHLHLRHSQGVISQFPHIPWMLLSWLVSIVFHPYDEYWLLFEVNNPPFLGSSIRTAKCNGVDPRLDLWSSNLAPFSNRISTISNDPFNAARISGVTCFSSLWSILAPFPSKYSTVSREFPSSTAEVQWC